MGGWFHVSELARGVWQLTEPGHVCSWLVAGERAAALIDTGCGFVPIRPVVEELTDLPVTVVNTHHHFDHVGGNHEWERIVIHPDGVAGLAAEVPREVLGAYARYAAEQVERFELYERLDRRFYHLLEDAHRVRPLPAVVAAGEWRIRATRATGVIVHGDVIELGARRLRVRHTPGHSRDCVCLELIGERILFGGDTVNTGPVYAQLADSHVATLRASLAGLAADAGNWDRIFCSHFMRTEVAPAYLVRQVAALTSLLDGEAPLRPAVDCLGEAVQEASFDGFSVLLPPAWQTPGMEWAA